MDRVTQADKILRFLEVNEWITPMDAWEHFHITKLATRIGEMIKRGIPIIKRERWYFDQSGKLSTRFMSYKLDKDAYKAKNNV